MAVVTTPYTYTDGNTLVPDSHNRNIFSSTSGEGIVSEPNGGLDTTNLAVGFEVKKEHVRYGDAADVRWDKNLDSLDYVDNAFSARLEGQGTYPSGRNGWVPIAGTGMKFYLHFPGTVLFMWQVFISPCRMIYIDSQDVLYSPAMAIRCYHQGAALTHTLRALPETYAYDITAASFETGHFESRGCLTFDLSHLVASAAEGWHDISARLFMERTGGVSYPNFLRRINGNDYNTDHSLYNRTTIGVKNARALYFS